MREALYGSSGGEWRCSLTHPCSSIRPEILFKRTLRNKNITWVHTWMTACLLGASILHPIAMSLGEDWITGGN